MLNYIYIYIYAFFLVCYRYVKKKFNLEQERCWEMKPFVSFYQSAFLHFADAEEKSIVNSGFFINAEIRKAKIVYGKYSLEIDINFLTVF